MIRVLWLPPAGGEVSGPLPAQPFKRGSYQLQITPFPRNTPQHTPAQHPTESWLAAGPRRAHVRVKDQLNAPSYTDCPADYKYSRIGFSL